MKIAVRIVRAWRRLWFAVKAPGRIHVGPEFVIGPSARLARGATLRAGSRVNIGAEFDSQVHLDIGDHVMISSRVAFVGNDHAFDKPGLTIQEQQRLPMSRIVLEGDNLIGYGTLLVGNVVVGRGAIVGAGSLVTKDLPRDTVCVGRPAKPIRKRR